MEKKAKTKRRSLLVATGLLSAAVLAGALKFRQSAPAEEALADFHKKIIKRYANVQHISSEEFSKINRDNILLFDVREKEEYKVSHLPNAIRVSPDMPAEAFFEKYADSVRGKTLVFYCSVGERSSRFAQALNAHTKKHHFETLNLEGGLFNWHNENRELSNTNGLTDNIHPYNKYWGRLLVNQDKIRFE